jgi:hypothetical protein
MELARLNLKIIDPEALRDLEALTVGYGFHPQGFKVGKNKSTLFFDADRLFCLCCGSRISSDVWKVFKGHCHECQGGTCSRSLLIPDFFGHHGKFGQLLDLVLR